MRARLTNALCVGAFYVAFLVTYRYAITPFYEYFGMGWRNPPWPLLLATFLMNVSLGWMVNPVYRHPSQVFLIIQLLVVFLPASIVCLNVTLPEIPFADAFLMIAVMYVGMVIQTLFSEGRRAAPARPVGSSDTARSVLRLLFVFACVVLCTALISLGDVFSLTNLQSMYEQRDILDERSVSAFLRYGVSWLVAFVIPILGIVGLRQDGARRAWLLAFCLLAYFVIFGLTATKTSLFAPLIILCIYAALKPTRVSFVQTFAFGFTAMLCVPLVLSGFEGLDLVTSLYVSVVNFRIFAVPQLLYVQYLDFFSNHPHTLGSHVSIVSSLIDYPFSEPVYLAVGEYFYPGSNMTANAGAWAQDGLAGFGLVGILGVSILFTLVMRMLDAAASHHDPRVVGGALAMLTMFISNTSLFTTLVSGGLAIAIFLLWFTGRSGHGATRRAHGSSPAAPARAMPAP